MARPRQKIPPYRKHKASGRGLITIGGRDIYLPGRWKSAESRAEYRRLIAELAGGGVPAAASVPDDGDDDTLSVAEVLARYVRFCTAYYAKSPGEMNRVGRALVPVRKLYGRTPAVRFGPRALEAVRHSMITDGLGLRTINQRVDRIKRAFKWAVRQEIVPPGVWHALQTVEGLRWGRSAARDPEIVKPVADADVDAVLPHLLPPVRAMVELQLVTGARPGEVVIMRRADLDTSGALWTYRPQQHKGLHRGHDRTVYLGARAQEIIRPFLAPDLDGYLFRPADAMRHRYQTIRAARKSKVQPSQESRAKRRPRRKPRERYDVASYRRAIERGCDRVHPFAGRRRLARLVALVNRLAHRAGHDRLRPALRDALKAVRRELSAWHRLHRWHPHQLRHNAGTRLRKEFGLEAARLILGHRSAVTTEIYAEADRAKAAAIMERVG